MHTTPSGKKYIGITGCSLSKRWKNGEGYNQCPVFYNAIKKYGWSNIEHYIVKNGCTEAEAKELEKELIAKYKTKQRKYGYNLTDGGDGSSGYKHTIASKSKMVAHHANFIGEKNPFYGRTLTPEHLAKTRRTGSHLTDATKAKISAANKNVPRPMSFIIKMSGENNYSFGRFGKDSAVARPVYQIDDIGNRVKRWDSISDACRQLGIKNQVINKSLHKGCRGGGYHWIYA